jgi:Uncharacterized protein conserved in bacteria (DUF2059)
MLELTAPLYAERFSTAELKEAIAFYKSPTGAKFIAAQPQILEQSIAIGQSWGARSARNSGSSSRMSCDHEASTTTNRTAPVRRSDWLSRHGCWSVPQRFWWIVPRWRSKMVPAVTYRSRPVRSWRATRTAGAKRHITRMLDGLVLAQVKAGSGVMAKPRGRAQEKVGWRVTYAMHIPYQFLHPRVIVETAPRRMHAHAEPLG